MIIQVLLQGIGVILILAFGVVGIPWLVFKFWKGVLVLAKSTFSSELAGDRAKAKDGVLKELGDLAKSAITHSFLFFK